MHLPDPRGQCRGTSTIETLGSRESDFRRVRELGRGLGRLRGLKIPAHSSCCSVVLVRESTEACGVPKLRTDTESEAIHRWNRILAPHSLLLQTPDGDGCLGSAPTTAAQVASDLPLELFRKVGRQAKHAFIRKALARSGRAQRGSPWSLLSGRREAPGSGQRRSRFVPKPPQRRTPHDHQRETVANIVAGFRTADRGQAMMACGTGKTLVGLLVAEATESTRRERQARLSLPRGLLG